MARENAADVAAPGARATRARLAADFARLLGRALILALFVGLLLTAAAAALAAEAQEAGPRPESATSGSLLVRRTQQDAWALSTTLATEVGVRVAGVVARASVRQRFRNESADWLEGVYVFPLPENAAVDHLLMRVGERTIEGQIREREQAKAEYRQARDEGRKAGLVEQERPNVFTTSVANLGPGEDVVVEIEFQQTLSFDEGEVRLRFPLVVAPRYVPFPRIVASDAALAGLGALFPADDAEEDWLHDCGVPDASRVTPPLLPADEAPRNPVTLDVELDAGFPVRQLLSRYHAVVSEKDGEGRYRVRLRDERVVADRDFELAWTPEPATMPRAASFIEQRGGDTYALVTLFPPVGTDKDAVKLPREVVFVIDTSGSMEGLSIQQARRALLLAIERLTPADRFNVIEFNSATTKLWPETRPAVPEYRSEARAWVRKLRAQGGTEMAPALEAALADADDPRLVRQVVFLTDGSVSNEEQLFGIIRQRLGESRLFTVGIGSAPNSHFMTKAAEFGRGAFSYVGDVREVEEKMGRLFALLESPVLTDVEVAWPAGAVVEAWPPRIPDLYLGEPIVVSARLTGPADRVSVAGRRGGREWSTGLDLSGGRQGSGAAVLWARRKIGSLLDSLHEGADADEVRAGVVALGLEHHLVTRHTSLVAVDVTPARPAEAGLQTAALPTNLPHGWSYAAVGELPRTATPAPFHALVALCALLGALALRLADRAWRAGERS